MDTQTRTVWTPESYRKKSISVIHGLIYGMSLRSCSTCTSECMHGRVAAVSPPRVLDKLSRLLRNYTCTLVCECEIEYIQYAPNIVPSPATYLYSETGRIQGNTLRLEWMLGHIWSDGQTDRRRWRRVRWENGGSWKQTAWYALTEARADGRTIR